MHTKKQVISLYHIKKAAAKSLVVLFSVLLILSNFSFSFADNPSVVELPQCSGTNDHANMYLYGYSNNWRTAEYVGADNANEAPIYLAAYYSSSTLIIACFTPVQYEYAYNNYQLKNITSYNSTYQLYYDPIWTGDILGLTLTPYSDLASACQGVLDFINSSNIPEDTYNYTLQNGWLSVIDLGASGASYNLTLNTSFAEYSHLSQPWWDSTQRYWFTDTMPAVGSTITNSETGTLIPWDKTGNTDLFGRSKFAIATLSGISTAKYMVIYNPAYHLFNMFLSGNKTESNLPVSISGIPKGSTITLFKMDETMHLTNGITSQYISDSGSAVATGSALNITDSFVDTDGNSVIQNSGGGNDIHESSGIVSYIVSINDTLDNFTEQFIQLLSAPITHIQQLISSGSNFFSVFGSLFTWLPTEAYQVIIGAFIVMVVIGVIKLLL